MAFPRADSDEESHNNGHAHAHSHSHSHSHVAGQADHHHAAAQDLSVVDDHHHHGRASLAETNLAETKAVQRKLKRATAFVLVFFVVEVVGGIWSGSLAIISDAAHLLTDVSGFILAMVANEIASRPACGKLTYGPVRAEVLSALFSTVTILVLSMLLVYSAVVRIIEFSRGQGEEIDGKMMSFIAFLGLLVNVALLGIFGHEHAGHDHSHGHGHAHDDDDGGGGGGGHDHHHHHDEEEGGGVVGSGKGGGGGAGERAPLVDSINSTGGSRLPPFGGGGGGIDISSSSENSGAGTDKYGSLVVRNGAAAVAAAEEEGEEGAGAGVEGFPEVGAEVAVLKKTKTKNINMEAAMLHAVTDLIQSAGVLVAGLLIWYDPRWKWADPIVTLLFVGLVVNSTRWLLQRAFNVLLEGVPDSMDYEKLRQRLSEIHGVTDLHCLHVWSLTLGRTVVSAHMKATDPEKALAEAHGICEAMGVAHSTFQVQVDHCLPDDCKHPCVSAVSTCCGPAVVATGGLECPSDTAPASPPWRDAS